MIDCNYRVIFWLSHNGLVHTQSRIVKNIYPGVYTVGIAYAWGYETPSLVTTPYTHAHTLNLHSHTILTHPNITLRHVFLSHPLPSHYAQFIFFDYCHESNKRFVPRCLITVWHRRCTARPTAVKTKK